MSDSDLNHACQVGHQYFPTSPNLSVISVDDPITVDDSIIDTPYIDTIPEIATSESPNHEWTYFSPSGLSSPVHDTIESNVISSARLGVGQELVRERFEEDQEEDWWEEGLKRIKEESKRNSKSTANTKSRISSSTTNAGVKKSRKPRAKKLSEKARKEKKNVQLRESRKQTKEFYELTSNNLTEQLHKTARLEEETKCLKTQNSALIEELEQYRKTNEMLESQIAMTNSMNQHLVRMFEKFDKITKNGESKLNLELTGLGSELHFLKSMISSNNS